METPGLTQITLEGLHTPSGLGVSWDPQEELEIVAGEKDMRTTLLNLLPMQRLKMDDWINRNDRQNNEKKTLVL